MCGSLTCETNGSYDVSVNVGASPLDTTTILNVSLTYLQLASFSGSCIGGEKRAWYTLFAHAQFSQDFWEFGNSHKICSVTLTSVSHADFSRIKDACHRPHSLQTMTKERRRSDEGTQPFVYKSCQRVHSS